jgi:DNA-binding winged helix-turn-helix (wHTH) protein
MRYLFAEFVLDVGTRQLLQAGREVPLAPKGFELLEILLRCRPQAVSRTRLTAALWPSSHVGPTSLHVLASQVRAALGDDAGTPRWIRTVPRFGYAFAGPASEEPAAGTRPRGDGAAGEARTRLVFDEAEIDLADGAHVIGREQGVDVRIDTPGVSRRHARLVITGGEAVLEDLGSKNGTFVRDERLSAPRALKDGDVVRLGRHSRFRFTRRAERLTETEGP